jgi:heptosyltransferase-1
VKSGGDPSRTGGHPPTRCYPTDPLLVRVRPLGLSWFSGRTIHTYAVPTDPLHYAPHPPRDRILIIRPSALGDVCRSVPVLVSLKRAFPSASIDWLVQDSFVDAVRAHPDLSEAIPFQRGRFGKLAMRGRFAELFGWLGQLRCRRYDLVVDAQGLARSGFIARATAAPRRIGYADARELGWLGYTQRCRVPRGLHAVDRMLELLRSAGIPPVPDMRLYPPEVDPRWMIERSLSRYVVLAPTSRWPGKRWPADRFAALAAGLLDIGVEQIALVGSASERDQIGPLLDWAANERGAGRVIDLIGSTSVASLMWLIKGARLVVASDSAALHMAVGFNRPAVALFGPTRIALVGPYHRDADVIQHITPADTLNHKRESAGRALMDRITVAEVLEAATHRLAN